MKKKKLNLTISLLIFLIAIFAGIYCIIVLPKEFIFIIASCIAIIISGYLVFDGIKIEIENKINLLTKNTEIPETDKSDNGLNKTNKYLLNINQKFDEIIELQKAIYVSIKKNTKAISDDNNMIINKIDEHMSQLLELEKTNYNSLLEANDGNTQQIISNYKENISTLDNNMNSNLNSLNNLDNLNNYISENTKNLENINNNLIYLTQNLSNITLNTNNIEPSSNIHNELDNDTETYKNTNINDEFMKAADEAEAAIIDMTNESNLTNPILNDEQNLENENLMSEVNNTMSVDDIANIIAGNDDISNIITDVNEDVKENDIVNTIEPKKDIINNDTISSPKPSQPIISDDPGKMMSADDIAALIASMNG